MYIPYHDRPVDEPVEPAINITARVQDKSEQVCNDDHNISYLHSSIDYSLRDSKVFLPIDSNTHRGQGMECAYE